MFNMKECKKYNMKEAFEEKRDFDFTIYLVRPRRVDGIKQLVTVPVNSFTMFGISVIEARRIVKVLSSTSAYICSVKVINPNIIDYEM